jgi:hypothetical protein
VDQPGADRVGMAQTILTSATQKDMARHVPVLRGAAAEISAALAGSLN